MKTTFLVWTPFTGLGAYGGFRGNRWLRNRIKIFKQFVIPSLQNQTDQDFTHWIAWRPEERNNPHVRALGEYLDSINYRFVFTFGGLCMWDDKFDEDAALRKLTMALHLTLQELADVFPETPGIEEEVQVLLNPSDDLYAKDVIAETKNKFKSNPALQAYGYSKGWISNYHTREILEYNPKTNPPFFTARFPRKIFFDLYKHLDYISMKRDEGKYKAGTPYASHEYIPNAFNMEVSDERKFLVGTHGENISTHFNHPYGGAKVIGTERSRLLDMFGIYCVGNLKIPFSFRKWVIRKMPYKWQRKFRYIFGEKMFQRFYNFIRN